jgi:hypothetical protein
VLRKIVGFKRKKVTCGWRKLHNEELCNFYFVPNIIRMSKLRLKLASHVAHMGQMRNADKILVRKPEGKRPLEGSGYR